MHSNGLNTYKTHKNGVIYRSEKFLKNRLLFWGGLDCVHEISNIKSHILKTKSQINERKMMKVHEKCSDHEP